MTHKTEVIFVLLFWASSAAGVTGGVLYGSSFEREGALLSTPHMSTAKCRAVLFEDRYVITAAHCLQSDIRYFYLFSTNTMYWISPYSVHTHPEFDFKKDPSANDIAVFKLDEPVKDAISFRPLRILNENPLLGVVGTLYTAKHDEDRYFPGIQVKALFKISSVEKFLSPKNSFSVVPVGSDKKICRGDSGAPFVVTLDSEDFLVGISSNGPSIPLLRNSSGFCRYTLQDIFTSVGVFDGWLRETIKKLSSH